MLVPSTSNTPALTLKLHKAQLKVLHSPARVKALVCGRGFGKTVFALTSAILFCLSYKGAINPASPQIVLVSCPTLKMAKTLFWIPLLNLLENHPLVESINKSDFRITWKGNRPDLLVRGADLQGNRLRGLNIVYAICDEYADFHSSVWPLILKPALARNHDWQALMISTPKGKTNHLYKFVQEAIAFPDYEYFRFTTADNPFVLRREINRARREMLPKSFRQEFEASFEDFSGQLFSAIKDHHKADAIPARFKTVFLGADWGALNPFLVVVGVTHTGEYYLIDYWQNNTGLPITEDELKLTAANFERKYKVYRCYLPDDRPDAILAFRRYGKKHSLPGMQRSIQVVRSKPGPMARALIGNTLFHNDRLYFGPLCHDLYADFEGYHRATDKDGNLTAEPAKGQNDHSIDASLHVIGQLEGKYITAGTKAA